MITVSKREKKLLYLAATAVAVFLVLDSWILPYWDSLSDVQETVDIQSKRLQSFRKILRGQETVQAALDFETQQLSNAEQGLLSNPTDALAGAEIQSLIKELTAAHGLQFQRSDLLPVKSVSPEYSKVSARIEVNGPIDRLVNFLASFETSSKTLFVEEMRVAPTHINVPKEKNVRGTLTISALKRIDPVKPLPEQKL